LGWSDPKLSHRNEQPAHRKSGICRTAFRPDHAIRRMRLIAGHARYIGLEKMLCIYCNERDADAREHCLPECLGRFENFEPLLARICQQCNEGIGGALEREFCRKGPEAVLRSTHWIKGQQRGGRKKRKAHIYQPERIGGQHLYFFAPDPETGLSILWQTDQKPRTVKETSQLVIFDDEGEATNASLFQPRSRLAVNSWSFSKHTTLRFRYQRFRSLQLRAMRNGFKRYSPLSMSTSRCRDAREGRFQGSSSLARSVLLISVRSQKSDFITR
jgi:hypothetical protein